MKKTKEIFVINPLEKDVLSAFLDNKSKEIIKYFIIKSLFSQPESKVNQRQLPIQIPKEHIEQWFTQALEVKPVGAGSFPIDIYNEKENWGADIKMLNITITKNGEVSSKDSGEASLGQKFAGPGIELDQMFKSANYDLIKNQWMNLLKEKFNSLNKNYKIKKIFYFFILRPGVQKSGADFYFCGASLDLKKVDAVQVNKQRTTNKSVFLENFINQKFGNVKIYKAKKRLELRLKPKSWIDDGLALKITTNFTPKSVDLRKENIGPSYLKTEINKLSSVEIKFLK